MSGRWNNCPAFRGIVYTHDYAWVNDTVGAVEGILNTTTDQAIVRAFACENQLATAAV